MGIVCSDEKGGGEIGVLCMVDVEPVKKIGSLD